MVPDETDPRVEPFVEAQLRLALLAERAFLRVEIPRYVGPPSRRAYDLWAQDVLNPWVQYRFEHLETTLTEAFTRVVNAHVPRWEVAANAALAGAFVAFACEIRDVPLPPELMGASTYRRVPRCPEGVRERLAAVDPR